MIIDDIQDDSAIRRNKPTMHNMIGVPAAINCGSWMIMDAIDGIRKWDTSTSNIHISQQMTIECLKFAWEGQALDVLGIDRGLVETDPMMAFEWLEEIHRRKTGIPMGCCAALVGLCCVTSGLFCSQSKLFNRTFRLNMN
jgi:geranylgeranyl pyrophosphate synthase